MKRIIFLFFSILLCAMWQVVQGQPYRNQAIIPQSAIEYQNGTNQMIYSGEGYWGNSAWYVEIKFNPGSGNRENGEIPTGVYTVSNGANNYVQGTVCSGSFDSNYNGSGTFMKYYNYSYGWSLGAVYAATYNKGYIQVKRPHGNLYIYGQMVSSNGTIWEINMGDDAEWNGTTVNLDIANDCNVNTGSNFTLSGTTASGDEVHIALKESRAEKEYDFKNFEYFKNTNQTYLIINGETIATDEAAGTISMSGGTWCYDFSLVGYNRTIYRISNNYTVNIPTPTNGSILVKNGETIITDGTKIAGGTALTVETVPDPAYSTTSLTANGNPIISNSYTVNSNTTIEAAFNIASSYLLTWNLDGGNISIAGTNDGNYAEGSSIIAPQVSKPGYRFIGWKADGDDTNFTGTMPARNVSYIAQWESVYTATFYGEGLSGNVYKTELSEGDAVRAPALPERTDANGTYVFSGWFSDYTHNVITDFSGVTMPAQNVTYYATWTLTQNEHICLDGDNDTMESLPTWQLTGTGSFFDDHNAYYEEDGDHAMYDDFLNFRPLEENKDIKDILHTTVNGSIVDSITYVLHWTASPKYGQYMRGLGVITDGRVDLGTFYVDDETNYINDGHTYTLADLGEATEALFSLKIEGGTKTYGCDSVVKFTLARTPVTATYTLTWDANGGTIEDDFTGDILDKIVVTDIAAGAFFMMPSEDPERIGYTFDDWDENLTSTMPDHDLTIKALWTPNTYTISFNKGGADGEETMDRMVMTYDVPQALTANAFTYTGRTFTGWKDESGTNYTDMQEVSNLTAVNNGNITLTAQWAATATYTLTWDANGGTIEDDLTGDILDKIVVTDVEVGAAIIMPAADPERTGYEYDDWDENFASTMPDHDLTIKALWTPHTYTISFNKGDADGEETMDRMVMTYDVPQALTANAFTYTGRTFTGWKDESGTNYTDMQEVSNLTAVNNGNITLTAQWAASTRTISWITDGDALEGSFTNGEVAVGTIITKPDTPTRRGYTFAGWYPEVAATMPDNNVVYTATWTAPATQATGCLDPEGYTNEGAFDWWIEGFNEHNDKYENFEYVTRDTVYCDTLRSYDNSFDSIFYSLELTYGTMYKQYNRFITLANGSTSSQNIDFRVDLGTFYLDDETDEYTNDGNTYTLANLEGKPDSLFSLKIKSGTAGFNCDSVVKFILTQSPLLTWDATGGIIPEGTYTNGRTKPTTSIIAPEDPTLEGYTFNGWNTAADGTGSNYSADATMPESDLTYYAQWTAETYNITYLDENGEPFSGTQGEGYPTTHTYGTATTLVSPTKDNHTFDGWFTKADCTGTPVTEIGATDITADITLYAKWTVNTFVLTFYGEGLTGNVQRTDVAPGTVIVAPELPERTGTDAYGEEFNYTFNGWYPELPEGTTMPMNDVTYYATWSVPTVIVNNCMDSDGETEFEDYYWEIPGFDTHNDMYDPQNGYTYDHINKTYYDVMRSSDNSFDSITYSLTMNYTRMYKRYLRFGFPASQWVDDRIDLGIIYLDDESDSYTNDGNTFTLANLEGKTDSLFSLPITGGTVTYGCDSVVKFVLTQTPLLTWDATGGIIPEGTYTNGRTKPNSAIVAPDVPTREGYTFNVWNTAADGTGSNYSADATMPATDLTYYAQWTAKTYNITYEELNGATNINPTSYTVETEEIVLDDPGERDGYIFTGWTDESGAAITTIPTGSTGDRTITANWEEDLPKDVLLYDNWTAEQYAELFDTYRGKVINVIFKRSFKANEWTTFTLPFSFDFEGYNEFEGGIYAIDNATTDEENGIVLTFSPVGDIDACVPYLFRPTVNIVEPRFENVMFETFDSQTVTTPSGDVEFRSTTEMYRITRRTSLYINNDRLYYANQSSGTRMRAFRGYFELMHPEKMEYVQPRFRMPGMSESVEITEGSEDADETPATAVKYIQNDRLVIELNGTRYNAIGSKIQ